MYDYFKLLNVVEVIISLEYYNISHVLPYDP